MSDNVIAVLVGILVVAFLVAGIFYTKFQWTECRKDADHSFWFCVEHLD